ncbi:MAG TPA: transcription-repair coupling factor [Candidatus Eremiobacteraceae bacterium]|nr:transcription-repair coupling factor [Candidatus Eremiobacteraceae bacterium]
MQIGNRLLDLFSSSSPLVGEMQRFIRARMSTDILATAQGARTFVVAALWGEIGGQIVVWTGTQESADRFASDCAFYLEQHGSPVWSIAARDEVSDAPLNPTLQSARMEALAHLADGRPGVFCIPHEALRGAVRTADDFRRATRRLRVGDTLAWETLLSDLVLLGYERVDTVGAAGEFAVRGGIIDVFPPLTDLPLRLEFFGDTLESIRPFALADQRSVGEEKAIVISPWSDISDGAAGSLLDYAPEAVVVIEDQDMIAAADSAPLAESGGDSIIAADEDDDSASSTASTARPDADRRRANNARPDTDRNFTLTELVERTAQRAVLTFPSEIANVRIARDADEKVAIGASVAPQYGRSVERFVDDVRTRIARGQTVAIVSVGHRRVREMLDEADIAVEGRGHGQVIVVDGTLDAGFVMDRINLVVIGDAELFGHSARRHKMKAAKEGVPLSEADLKAGEYFVHANHGIGQYVSLERLTIDDVERDFMLLRYLGEDRLYVPIDQMHLVRKYVASDGAAPRLSKMGGSDWARTRARVREAVDTIAQGLVRLYAERETAQGHAFAPDTPWQAELEESFPYDETLDQASAIEAVKADMERPRPMDRLICGDVGYGKTEVAIRAAFKAIMDRKQVAVLVPTTVLAAQHFRTFSDRFAAFPVRIGLLSRFRTREEQKETLRDLHAGSVDIVVGTHRLLQKDVGFARLGLVIVDEEQRFGVMHKERLKELRRSVDVLTLSATPIPRTLHMAMVGVRDLSLIQTAPVNRVAIKTVVTPASDAVVGQALRQEFERNGQVYFVHNRIETIYGVAAALQALAPRARIVVGHGQMREGELEKVMVAFVNGEFDMLVSTTIIENGLDIPNVNTIIVNNADRFGLAQLYQLRGRVGRSAHQAYAYFLHQPHRKLTIEAESRLDAIREFSHLGSGLQLAMRDLEIRGAGNLLGQRQSGFIAAVGFETYCQILQEAIAQRRGEPQPPEIPPPVLDLRVSAYLPSEYVKGAGQKIDMYQRLAAARTIPEVDAAGEELRDRFGPLPAPVEALLELTRVRVLAAAKGVEKVALEQRRLTLEIGRRFSFSEQALPALTALTRGNFRFTQSAIVIHLPTSMQARDGMLGTVREILTAL